MEDAFDFEDPDDIPDPSEGAEEPIDVGGPDSARLADGRYLLLDGDSAGSIVETPEGVVSETPLPLVPSRDDALAGGRPLLLLHRPFHHWRDIPIVAAAAYTHGASNLAIGSVAAYSMVKEPQHLQYSAQMAVASVHIIDPEWYVPFPADLQVKVPSARRRSRAGHLTANDVDHVENLNLQRRCGANLLLTPGRALNPANPDDALDQLRADADEAQALVQAGERLALNITISSMWLRAEELRNELLAALLDWDDLDIWYVHVQMPAGQRAHTQIADQEVLRGYKELCELAENEEHRLLLPSTGLTGWLLMGLGAAAFGTSTSSSLQMFKGYVEQKGGTGSRINRYFERQILHIVEETSRSTLASDPAYVPCDCRFCQSLFSSALWSHSLASLHQVFATAQLTAALDANGGRRGGRRGVVRRRVDSAMAFAAGKGLTEANVPRHLPAWRDVL